MKNEITDEQIIEAAGEFCCDVIGTRNTIRIGRQVIAKQDLLRQAEQEPLLDKDALAEKINETLGGLLHCTRTWQAWRAGTMTENDFHSVDESELAHEIADVVLALLNQSQPVQPAQELIYQYQLANGNWIDQAKESYDYNIKLGQAVVRVLYAAPVLQAEKELTPGNTKDADFWLRQFTAARQGEFELRAEIAALRQKSHDICMSRSLSLSKDGKHAEANEAQKCASAVMHAKLGAAYTNPVTPEESVKLKAALAKVFDWKVQS